MDRIRIGLVGGGGGVGWGSHLPAIEASSMVELVAVCDPNAEGLQRAVDRYGGQGFTDLGAMLAQADVDMVDIASPDFLHAEQAIQAAQAGKHILCEKPMALSLTDAMAMKEAVEATGVKFMVGQSQRWRPECVAFKQACDTIGEPAFAAYHVRGRFFPYPEDSFYRKKESLGQFVHNGTHWVDFMSWCVGSLPARVWAESRRHYPTDDRLETDNYLIAHVTYESGALGIFEMNLLMVDPPGFPHETRWYVVGSQGTAEWPGVNSRMCELFNANGLSSPGPAPPCAPEEPFRSEIDHLARCILDDETPCIDIDWSMRVLATCIGAVESAETGQTVSLS